ncbi:MAG: response regulator [Methylococcales bacterium]|nr:response regulator [Methylococcales bacterium]
MKILVVDDDLEICKLLCQYLDKQGFSIASVEDGKALDEYLSQSLVDLIILDLMLPGEDGLSIVKRLNIKLDIPIIMLSACGEDVDRIIGLEIGADDYLAKPFNPRELLARIRSVLRRRSIKKSSSVKEDLKPYTFGNYEFNTSNQSLHREGEKVILTSGEFSLLKIFVENPKRILSRDDLLEKLKGYDCAPFDRSIDVRIMRLRQKIEMDTTSPVYIQTVWGKGYQFIPNQSVE